MKNKIALLSILSLMFVFAMSSCGKKEEPKDQAPKDTTTTVQQQQAPEETVPEGWTKLDAPVVGKVVCLSCIVASKGECKMTNDDAKMCTSKGAPLGVLAGDVFCFVYNIDGSSADKTLATHADKENVELTGYTKTVSGMKLIMAKEIKPGPVATVAEEPKKDEGRKGK